MKKILLVVLLSFSTFTFANDDKYTIINAFDTPEMGAVYILNKETGSIKLCQYAVATGTILCTKWFENEE